MADLRVQAEVRVTGGSASAAELGRVTAATQGLEAAQNRLGVSAGQVRASTAQLGQQIGDVTQGLAAGINPATIFAQQAGQVAFALGGLGGKLGAVGTFLSGPWGALLLGATTIAVTFGSALFRAGDAGDAAGKGAQRHAGAATNLKDAIEDLDKATGRYNLSQRETINLSIEAAKREFEKALATRKTLAATLEARQAQLDASNRFDSANPVGSAAIDGLRTQIKNNEVEIGKTAGSLRAADAVQGLERVKQATDKAAAATGAYERAERSLIAARTAGGITQREFETGLTAATTDRNAALAAIRETTKAAATGQREHNKELRDAAREAAEATRAVEAFNAAVGAGVRSIANNATFGQLPVLAFKDIEDAAATKTRATDTLADRVKSIDDKTDFKQAAMATAAVERGKKIADGFREGTLADAAALGQIIGGKAGQAFAGIAALGFGTKGANGVNSDLTGAGSRVEKLLQPLSDVFGGGGKKFAGLIGKAAGGAATGGVVSGIADAVGIKLNKTGSQIGGAIGSFIPIPGGEIIGSILGGIIGNLFSVKQGSTTVSSSDGKISQSSTGDKAIQKATGAIGNTISDAIQSIADSLGADVGKFSVSIGKRNDSFRIDSSGTGKIRGPTVTATKDEGEALQLAIADAFKDGAIVASPRIQAALLRYSDNVNKAVAEALKVKGLEDLLTGRDNPFLGAFRTLEVQLKQRLRVAKDNGFDLVAIEKINGEDRARALKETLGAATGSIRDLLREFQFGSRATGSAAERLAGLTTERDRVGALARGGDTSQIDVFARILQQIDDLQKTTFGSTQGFADGRAASISLANDLISQTEARIKAAADRATAGTDTTNTKLTELNASADDQVALLAASNGLLGRIATSLAGGGGGVVVGGGRPFDLSFAVSR